MKKINDVKKCLKQDVCIYVYYKTRQLQCKFLNCTCSFLFYYLCKYCLILDLASEIMFLVLVIALSRKVLTSVRGSAVLGDWGWGGWYAVEPWSQIIRGMISMKEITHYVNLIR